MKVFKHLAKKTSLYPSHVYLGTFIDSLVYSTIWAVSSWANGATGVLGSSLGFCGSTVYLAVHHSVPKKADPCWSPLPSQVLVGGSKLETLARDQRPKRETRVFIAQLPPCGISSAQISQATATISLPSWGQGNCSPFLILGPQLAIAPHHCLSWALHYLCCST